MTAQTGPLEYLTAISMTMFLRPDGLISVNVNEYTGNAFALKPEIVAQCLFEAPEEIQGMTWEPILMWVCEETVKAVRTAYLA